MPGTYLKRVQIVEVLDSEGNPWEPVPGPDPWDELVVQTDTHWSNGNNYVKGETVYAHPAKFLGGNPDDTTYRYRWQHKVSGSDGWTNSSWTSYNNNSIEVDFTIPAAAVEMRLMSQARDASTDPVTRSTLCVCRKDSACRFSQSFWKQNGWRNY